MSLQSYTEELLRATDKIFEREANTLVNEARQRSGKEAYTAGRMDGISEAVAEIKRVYKLFVKEEKEEEDAERALY